MAAASWPRARAPGRLRAASLACLLLLEPRASGALIPHRVFRRESKWHRQIAASARPFRSYLARVTDPLACASPAPLPPTLASALSDLPIAEALPDILRELQNNNVTVLQSSLQLMWNCRGHECTTIHVCNATTLYPVLDIATALSRSETVASVLAPPGAGKTTAVPLVLASDAATRPSWLGDGKVLVLEPRRVAARSAAGRMAELLGEAVGETVGYRVRQDSVVGPRTQIEVLTEGVLVRQMQRDPSLTGALTRACVCLSGIAYTRARTRPCPCARARTHPRPLPRTQRLGFDVQVWPCGPHVRANAALIHLARRRTQHPCSCVPAARSESQAASPFVLISICIAPRLLSYYLGQNRMLVSPRFVKAPIVCATVSNALEHAMHACVAFHFGAAERFQLYAQHQTQPMTHNHFSQATVRCTRSIY
eukprot:6181564-Pleurochrysis_carterae.AAC.3